VGCEILYAELLTLSDPSRSWNKASSSSILVLPTTSTLCVNCRVPVTRRRAKYFRTLGALLFECGKYRQVKAENSTRNQKTKPLPSPYSTLPYTRPTAKILMATLFSHANSLVYKTLKGSFPFLKNLGFSRLPQRSFVKNYNRIKPRAGAHYNFISLFFF
jgi:hypothetical protein